MKKLLITACFMLGFAGLASAQEAAKKNAPAKAVKLEKAKPAHANSTKNITAPKKADGTPDMRYNVNRTETPQTEGPVKADGTPDLRYNENKNKKKPE